MYRISIELAEKLRGKTFHREAKFNPIKDINGNWFISDQELEGCTNWRYKEDLEGLKKEEFIPPKEEDLV